MAVEETGYIYETVTGQSKPQSHTTFAFGATDGTRNPLSNLHNDTFALTCYCCACASMHCSARSKYAHDSCAFFRSQVFANLLIRLYVQNMILVDGEWSEWQPWTACSASCGLGSQSRIRNCDNPPPSDAGLNCTYSSREDGYQQRTCSTGIPCPGMFLILWRYLCYISNTKCIYTITYRRG